VRWYRHFNAVVSFAVLPFGGAAGVHVVACDLYVRPDAFFADVIVLLAFVYAAIAFTADVATTRTVRGAAGGALVEHSHVRWRHSLFLRYVR